MSHWRIIATYSLGLVVRVKVDGTGGNGTNENCGEALEKALWAFVLKNLSKIFHQKITPPSGHILHHTS